MDRRRTHRRPVWQPSRLSRLNAFLKSALGRVTFVRLALTIFALPLLIYVYREITRDVLIFEPFTVPKRFEEAGLTSEVMANRIGGTLHQIEIAAQTGLKKDNPTSIHDEESIPDVEIPGTKLGLKTLVDLTRSVFGIDPRHVGGDIVTPVDGPTSAESSPVKRQATVTVYLTQGRGRSAPVSIVVDAADVGTLVERTAETILEQVNPYVLAVYRMERRENEKAVEIAERITQDPSADLLHKHAAFYLWGLALYKQNKYDQAIAKYQKAIDLDPKYAPPYDDWGNALSVQKKYDEAIAKYQKAIDLDPKSALPYNHWGIMLDEQKKHNEAITKYQKAIDLDPKYAPPYINWGNALSVQKKYDEAIAKYQKAIDLDPKYAIPYISWGATLYEQKKYNEAIAKYQKAIDLDPKFALPYDGWGLALRAQQKYDEAL
jgi:tetratricopeptide (TPR) repeat protein